jgi:hypothetical protein
MTRLTKIAVIVLIAFIVLIAAVSVFSRGALSTMPPSGPLSSAELADDIAARESAGGFMHGASATVSCDDAVGVTAGRHYEYECQEERTANICISPSRPERYFLRIGVDARGVYQEVERTTLDPGECPVF